MSQEVTQEQLDLMKAIEEDFQYAIAGIINKHGQYAQFIKFPLEGVIRELGAATVTILFQVITKANDPVYVTDSKELILFHLRDAFVLGFDTKRDMMKNQLIMEEIVRAQFQRQEERTGEEKPGEENSSWTKPDGITIQ